MEATSQKAGQVSTAKQNGAVSVVQPAQAPAAQASEATALIQMIERAAMNPDVDIDKMDRLWTMYERIQGKKAAQEFSQAMCLAQAEMEPIRATADNKQTHSKYATYADLDRAIRPIYTDKGFSLSFNTAPGAPADWVRIVCDVAHQAGHTKVYTIDMPADGKGAKGGDVMTKTHATVSAVSYGMRRLAGMIFNLAIDKDDDGNDASPRVAIRQISEKQLNILKSLIDETNADIRKVCAHFGVEGLAMLTTDRYQEAFELLKARKRVK